jgi:hypothetical protein
MKRILIRLGITLFLLFGVESCAVFTGGMYEINPCFHLDDEYMRIECYKWRDNYPREYNIFYDKVKKKYIDSVYLSLPPKVEFKIKSNGKVIPLK